MRTFLLFTLSKLFTMPVFHNVDGTLRKLGFMPLEKEKSLQKLVEENLLEVLDMQFIASEFSTTHGGRIDTIAIDSNGAPVLIEYKRSVNVHVIPQALFYLTWLQSQTVEFFEGLIKKKWGVEKIPKINWHNPRVICITERYNKYDVIGFKRIPELELYRFQFHENDIFVIDKISDENDKYDSMIWGNDLKMIEDVKQNDINNKSAKVIDDLREINRNNLANQLERKPQFVKELFELLSKKIFELDENISRKDNPQNVAFRISKAFAEIHFRKDHLLIYLRAVDYDDPKGKIFKVPETHGWPLKRGIRIANEDELDYVMPCIEKSYKDVL